MSKNTVATRETLHKLAEKMIGRYVRDLLTAHELVERINLAWQENISEDIAGGATLEALARGLCSQALCEACRLPGGRLRNLAFERLSEYLERALGNAGGTIHNTASEVRQEVIQRTLVEILQSLQRERGKPEQPMAFLGWARVILSRQLTHYWHQKPPVELLSLDNQDEPLIAELIDEHALDPLTVVVRSEMWAELHTNITKLRNPNYREVLLKIYFSELEVREVADLLQVPTEDIHLWRHRALQALQKQINGTPAARRRAQKH